MFHRRKIGMVVLMIGFTLSMTLIVSVFRVHAVAPALDSSILSNALTSLQSNLTSIFTGTGDPTTKPANSLYPSPFLNSVTIEDKSSLFQKNSKTAIGIKTDNQEAGVIISNKSASGAALGVTTTSDTIGVYGKSMQAGILIDTYNSISPQVGVSAKSANIGTYSISSSYGVSIPNADQGFLSSGGKIGVIGIGNTGISVVNHTSAFDYSGTLTGTTSSGYLNYNNYGLYVPSESYASDLTVNKNVTADTLDSSILNVDDVSSLAGSFSLGSIDSHIIVQDVLKMSGSLQIGMNLDTSGSIYMNKGDMKVDGSILTTASALDLKGDVEVNNVARVGGKVAADNGIGSFYQVKAENSKGNPEASCDASDFLVSCSARIDDTTSYGKNQYVGARPKDSDTCQAFSQISNVTVTVYAYCFDPQGTRTTSF